MISKRNFFLNFGEIVSGGWMVNKIPYISNMICLDINFHLERNNPYIMAQNLNIFP